MSAEELLLDAFSGAAKSAAFEGLMRLQYFPRHPTPEILQFTNSWLTPHWVVYDDAGNYHISDNRKLGLGAPMYPENGGVYLPPLFGKPPPLIDAQKTAERTFVALEEFMKQLPSPYGMPAPQANQGYLQIALLMAQRLGIAVQTGQLQGLPLQRQRPLFSAEKPSVPLRVEQILKEEMVNLMRQTGVKI